MSLTEGFCLSGGEIRGFKKHWFKYYYSEASVLLDYWIKIYQLQLFLQSRKIKYCFSLAYDRDNLVEQNTNKNSVTMNFDWVFEQINWQNFVFYNENKGFLSFAKENKFKINKNCHPDTQAHNAWVNDILLNKIHSIL